MELLLTDRALHGLHLTSRPQVLKNQQRLSGEAELARVLDLALEKGVANLLCSAHPTLMKLLREPKRRGRFQLSAVVPDFQRYVRDTSHYGTTGAAIRRVLKMPFLQYRHLMRFAFMHLPALAGMKFEAAMNLFIIAEIAPFAGLPLKRIVLHRQITDLAIMLGHKRFFEVFLDMVRSQYGIEPGFVTQNFAALDGMLPKNARALIIAPFNAKGYLMSGNANARESVAADHWDLEGTVPVEEGLSFLQKSNFTAATVELETFLDAPRLEHLLKAL